MQIVGRDTKGDKTGKTLSITIHDICGSFNNVFQSIAKTSSDISHIKKRLSVDEVIGKRLGIVQEDLMYLEKRVSQIMIDIMNEKDDTVEDISKDDTVEDIPDKPTNTFSASGQPIDVHVK